MKAVNCNKIYARNINKTLRPFSVNTLSQKKYISPIRPLVNEINYNKNDFSHNRLDDDISEFSIYSDQKLISPKNNKIIGEIKTSKNKQNYENLNVKIYNLYNLKDKNRPFSIRINNSSPKYYINNCVNQLLLKNPNEKYINKNETIQLDERLSNNINNIKHNKFIFSLVSPKNKEYRRIDFSNNNNKNLVNSKIIQKIDNQRKNNQISQKGKKNINMNNFENLYYTNINQKYCENSYNYDSIFQEKNFDDNDNKQPDIIDKYFYKINKGTQINNNINVNNKKIYNNNFVKSNLTIENQKSITNQNKKSSKIRKIKQVRLTSPLNMKKTNKEGNNNKIMNNRKNNLKKIEKEKNDFNTIFDLKNNKFESETIKKIINEFCENEKKEEEKKALIEQNNKTKKTKNIKNTIPHQKPKFKKIIKNGNIIKVPQKIKKLSNENYEIYLQYNQNDYVEKILLNDKNGNITSFIPSISNKSKINISDTC